MQTLVIQIQNDIDYQLFLNLADRLNCKVLTKPKTNHKEEWQLSDAMKIELDKRHASYKKNPDEGYSMLDVKKELEKKLGRKIQVKTRG